MVYATFWWPDDRKEEPFARIAVGDYKELLLEYGNRDDVLVTYIAGIIHELTHYFQWVVVKKITEEEEDREAEAYQDIILDIYAQTRRHP